MLKHTAKNKALLEMIDEMRSAKESSTSEVSRHGLELKQVMRYC